MKTRDKKKIEELYKAVLSLNTTTEVGRFFRDLLTEKELLEFSNRWKAAQMLDQKIRYVEIAKETGLSSRTIARVADWLTNGMKGYRLVINRMNHHSSFRPGKELS